MNEDNKPNSSWWQSAPGISTAAGTVIVALTGLLGVLHQAGMFGVNDKSDPRHVVDTRSVVEPKPIVEPKPGSDWLTSAQYQQEFNTRLQKGFYPRAVEGKCQGDGEQFRTEWKILPLGVGFASHHGLTKEGYDNKNREYSSKGYSLESLLNFKDCSGIERYQATWLKKG